MPNRPRRSRSGAAARGRAAPTAALSVQAPSERLAALGREHDKLLGRIAAKKRELERLETAMREAAATFDGKLRPIGLEIEQLGDELHMLFAELLAKGRLKKGARGKVKQLYLTLQELGVISERVEDELEDAGLGDDDRHFEDEGEPFFGGPPPPGAGGFSARISDGSPIGESLRGVFRRLARALHPDVVQHDEEKARRTEAMKEITSAYEAGDLARLLELERAFLVDGDLRPHSGDQDDRCAALERTNAALRDQLEEVAEDLRELRRSPQALMMHDLKRAARGKGSDPWTALVAEATEDLTRTREIRDYVCAFRDGLISVDDLLAGPPSMRAAFSNEAELDLFLDQLFGADAAPAPRQKKGRGRRERSERRAAV